MQWFLRIILIVLANFYAPTCGATVQGSEPPRPLEPGELVANLTSNEAGAKALSLESLRGRSGTVIAVRDTSCSDSLRLSGRIAELAEDPTLSGFAFILLDVSAKVASGFRPATTEGSLQTIASPTRALARSLGATSATEVFFIDRTGTLRYRGAVDSQDAAQGPPGSPVVNWLRNAVTAVQRGDEPSVTLTDARARCALHLQPDATARVSEVSYHNRVSRVIQNKCQICHRVGGLGPMPLEKFSQVFARRSVIEYMVKSGRMPPWAADKKVGHWANDRSLSEMEKRDLLNWIGAGAPEGNPADAPLVRKFVTDWTIGLPDHVVRSEPVSIPADGAIDYVFQDLPTSFNEDKWIKAVEIRPSQSQVVHHVLAYIEDASLPPIVRMGVAGILGAGGPGALGIVFPEGTSKRLPKGARIRLEIHYQPNGTAVQDRIEVGLRFADKPGAEIINLAAYSIDFTIPPYHPRYQVRSSHRFERSGRLLFLLPHMHVRGAAFRYDLQYPDGKTVPLLDVPRYNFNWQSTYIFKTQMKVPAGAKIIATAWYDNSKANPLNPDPSKAVRSGGETTDEMMIGFFDFVEDPPASGPAPKLSPKSAANQ